VDAQIRPPAVKLEQRIVVGTQVCGYAFGGERSIEDPAQGDTVDVACVNAASR